MAGTRLPRHRTEGIIAVASSAQGTLVGSHGMDIRCLVQAPIADWLVLQNRRGIVRTVGLSGVEVGGHLSRRQCRLVNSHFLDSAVPFTVRNRGGPNSQRVDEVRRKTRNGDRCRRHAIDVQDNTGPVVNPDNMRPSRRN